jgi:hypothetical protein
MYIHVSKSKSNKRRKKKIGRNIKKKTTPKTTKWSLSCLPTVPAFQHLLWAVSFLPSLLVS